MGTTVHIGDRRATVGETGNRVLGENFGVRNVGKCGTLNLSQFRRVRIYDVLFDGGREGIGLNFPLSPAYAIEGGL